MKQILKSTLLVILIIGNITSSDAQITSPTAAFTQPTQYTNGLPDDEIFVFCSPDMNGNSVTGSLTANTILPGPGYTYEWGLYDDVTHTYTVFQTDNGVPSSTISGLQSGGYNVTITNNAGVSETYATWLYVSIVDVSVSLALDPVNPGCEPFDVNGTITASGFTYWDPIPPGAAPFIIDANTTVTVCFNANHTYVSDVGFVLIGPPGCGSPAFALYPHPEVVNPANGCCCNSGNNINNLCFSTANANQLNMCSSGTPLSGNYAMYNGGVSTQYPAGGISNIYGCNAAEGGWAVQIYDCIGADVGSLTGVTITFDNGSSTIVYDSGSISSAINDNSCDPATASIYVVPLVTPINPDPQQVPNQGTLTYQLGVNGVPVTLAPGTNSFTQTVDPIPTADEWYYLEIIDELGCSAIDSVLFDFTGYADATITDPIPTHPNNTFCLTEAAEQLTAVDLGGNWTGPGVDANGLFTPANAGIGNHAITYDIPPGCGDTDVINITVNNLSPPTMVSTDAICTATNGTATATPIDGNAPYTYSWDTTPIQTTQSATNLTAGNYNVILTDAGGCQSTASVVVGLDPSNLTTIINNSTNTLCNLDCNGDATVTVNGGTAPFQYLWDDPTGQTTAIANGLCANTFNVGIMDDNGCLATAQVVITEPSAITVVGVMDQEANCGQADGLASAIAQGGTAPNGYLYQWNSVPVQNAAAATGLLPQQYTVTAQDDNACTATATVDVTSTPPIEVDIILATDPLCKGSCDGLATAVAGANSVNGPNETYVWDSATPNNMAAATSLCANVLYTVIYTDEVGCTATADTMLGEPTLVVVDFTMDTNLICISGTDSLWADATGGTPGYTYAWTATPADLTLLPTSQNQEVAPLDTTTYSVVATDANGCVSAVQIMDVNVHPPLVLDVEFPITIDTSICPYDVALLSLIPSGGNGNYSIFLLPDLLNAITLPMIVQPADTTTYSFVLDDDCETPTVQTDITVNIKPMPQIDFVADPTSGCTPLTVNFEDLTVPTPAIVTWNFGDPTSGVGSPTGTNVSNTYLNVDTFDITITATTTEGCVDSATWVNHIVVYPNPEAFYIADPSYINLFDAQIQFTDLSTDSIVSWAWNFGDGSTSIDQNPQYFYSDTGVYQVSLEVTNQYNCTNLVVSEIEVYPDYTMYIPNSFTPNNDGINEVFKPLGEGFYLDSYDFRIFDRWGEEIFSTANYEEGWDGTYKGRQVEIATFSYQLEVIDLNNFVRKHYGHVTLTR